MGKKITVDIPTTQATSYPILINSGLLDRFQQWIPKKSTIAPIVIITDNTVKKLYGSTLAHRLKKQGHNVLLLAFSAGESSKNYKNKISLEEKMLREHCGRDTLCVALGGGVVGDLTGFIAATYMRGISYIQIPTTLLAMVDSSVGGKTGIDTPQGKNLIGAFWQPKAVIADIQCLKTLPTKQIINGFIEALKMFLTSDAKSFYYAQNNLEKIVAGDEKILQNLIYRAVKIKAAVVSQDEKENNQRMILNFGHTIGHALEKISDYKLLHGYAVAYGILVEAKIAQILGFLDNKNYRIIQSVFASLGIVGKQVKKFSINKIVQATKVDKKVKTGKVRYVLLCNIGEVHQDHKTYAHTVSDKIVKTAFLQIIRE